MVKVPYWCRVCRLGFWVDQHSPERDEDIDTCFDCLNIMFTDSSHGTFDDPWTPELILEARRRRDEAPLRVRPRE